MPVAQLVHLFESMDHFLTDLTHSDRSRSSKTSSVTSGKRLSLKMMFRSHTRVSSASSATMTVSTAASPSTPTFSDGSFEFLSAFPAFASVQTGDHTDHLAVLDSTCVFPELKKQPFVRPVRIHRTFSSTSIALQSELRIDQLQGAGLDLFEPRPHNIVHGSQTMPEPVVLDGIMQVMESG